MGNGNKLRDLAKSIRKSTGGEPIDDAEREAMEREMERIRKEQEDAKRREQERLRKRGGY